jgi:hypothetical protein
VSTFAESAVTTRRTPGDRVVIATTRQGFATLHGGLIRLVLIWLHLMVVAISRGLRRPRCGRPRLTIGVR